jgi:hypothetical protein
MTRWFGSGGSEPGRREAGDHPGHSPAGGAWALRGPWRVSPSPARPAPGGGWDWKAWPRSPSISRRSVAFRWLATGAHLGTKGAPLPPGELRLLVSFPMVQAGASYWILRSDPLALPPGIAEALIRARFLLRARMGGRPGAFPPAGPALRLGSGKAPCAGCRPPRGLSRPACVQYRPPCGRPRPPPGRFRPPCRSSRPPGEGEGSVRIQAAPRPCRR